MSQWTHIRGGFELESPAVELNKCKLSRPKGKRTEKNDAKWEAYWQEVYKKAYYPFPEEQLKIGVPTLVQCFDNECYTKVDAYEYSLPRARKYLEKAFEMLPQGELGWHYSILQDNSHCRSSSSDFDYNCSKKQFEKEVVDLYNRDNDGFYLNSTFKELEKYQKIRLGMVDHVHSFVIGIRDDLRYCSGPELQKALEKFFMYLEDNHIEVEDGYLEWQDEYDPDHIYAWRKSRIEEESHEFLILDRKTNKVIHSRLLKAKWDESYTKRKYEIIERDF